MKTATRQEIVDEVRKSIRAYGCSEQRYRQLAEVLSRRDSSLVGDALFTVWMELDDPNRDYAAQRFVGRLLVQLNPDLTVPLDGILRSLPSWNLSVEELPWYLARQFGEEKVLEDLRLLDHELSGDDVFLRASAAVRFWLQTGPGAGPADPDR